MNSLSTVVVQRALQVGLPAISAPVLSILGTIGVTSLIVTKSGPAKRLKITTQGVEVEFYRPEK